VTSTSLLTLKLVLVPGMIAVITLASRRWGPAVGGLLTGLPLVAGPTLYFFALEQGEVFAARAAGATLVGMFAVAAFCLAYAWLSVASAWFVALPVSWLVFGAISVALNLLPWPPGAALAVTTCGFVLARLFLPSAGGGPVPLVMPLWDLPLRMGAGAALVLSVTYMAAHLGPTLSGALIPFPIVLAIIVAFAHAQQGRAGVIHFLRGFLPAIWSFVVFCFIVQRAVVPLGRDLGFLLALAVQSGVHALVLRTMRAVIGRP
jgi:hypothetical protein